MQLLSKACSAARRDRLAERIDVVIVALAFREQEELLVTLRRTIRQPAFGFGVWLVPNYFASQKKSVGLQRHRETPGQPDEVAGFHSCCARLFSVSVTVAEVDPHRAFVDEDPRDLSEDVDERVE